MRPSDTRERYPSAALKRDAERLMREIPPDTRGLTEKLCGDPLPGRRAIDQRGHAIAAKEPVLGVRKPGRNA